MFSHPVESGECRDRIHPVRQGVRGRHMHIDEVMQIVNSNEDIAVFYGPKKVAIEEVNEENKTVTVKLLMSGTIEKVRARDLTRD